jgi:hypothetical protein
VNTGFRQCLEFFASLFLVYFTKKTISYFDFQRPGSQRRLLGFATDIHPARYGANGKDGASRCERGRAPPPRRSCECRGLQRLLHRCVYFRAPGLIPSNASRVPLPVDVGAPCGSFAARGRTSAPEIRRARAPLCGICMRLRGVRA